MRGSSSRPFIALSPQRATDHVEIRAEQISKAQSALETLIGIRAIP